MRFSRTNQLKTEELADKPAFIDDYSTFVVWHDWFCWGGRQAFDYSPFSGPMNLLWRTILETNLTHCAEQV